MISSKTKQYGFIDSHCHLDKIDLSEFENDFDLMIEYATKLEVSHMLCVAINLNDFDSMYRLVKNYNNIMCSVGVHPCEVLGNEPTIEKLLKYAENERVVAIGETGLDYYYKTVAKQIQQERFETHLHAARLCSLPVIVHTRDARNDTIQILKNNHADEIGGVLHCFTENWDMAKQALDLGFYISFSGILTFHNAIKLREIAKKVPMNRILIETDSPYLTPAPHRGKKNNPAFVRYVAESLAEIKKCDIKHIKQQTSDNFFKLFRQFNE